MRKDLVGPEEFARDVVESAFSAMNAGDVAYVLTSEGRRFYPGHESVLSNMELRGYRAIPRAEAQDWEVLDQDTIQRALHSHAATLESRNPPESVRLRIASEDGTPIRFVRVIGDRWSRQMDRPMVDNRFSVPSDGILAIEMLPIRDFSLLVLDDSDTDWESAFHIPLRRDSYGAEMLSNPVACTFQKGGRLRVEFRDPSGRPLRAGKVELMGVDGPVRDAHFGIELDDPWSTHPHIALWPTTLYPVPAGSYFVRVWEDDGGEAKRDPSASARVVLEKGRLTTVIATRGKFEK